jgi:filamentous hemagglutinin
MSTLANRSVRFTGLLTVVVALLLAGAGSLATTIAAAFKSWPPAAVPTYGYDAPNTTTIAPANTRGGAFRGLDDVRDVSRSRTLVLGAVSAAKGATHAIPEGRLGHVFRDAPGHLLDTPANRKLLQGVADDPATTLGADKFGNTWSARTLDDGTQAWTQTRNGDIINGGLNPTPRPFNPQTGLARPQRPRNR